MYLKGLWIKVLYYFFIKQAFIYFKKTHTDNKKTRRCHWPTVSVWHAKMAMYELVFINILGHTHKNTEICPNTRHLVEQVRESQQ